MGADRTFCISCFERNRTRPFGLDGAFHELSSVAAGAAAARRAMGRSWRRAFRRRRPAREKVADPPDSGPRRRRRAPRARPRPTAAAGNSARPCACTGERRKRIRCGPGPDPVRLRHWRRADVPRRGIVGASSHSWAGGRTGGRARLRVRGFVQCEPLGELASSHKGSGVWAWARARALLCICARMGVSGVRPNTTKHMSADFFFPH